MKGTSGIALRAIGRFKAWPVTALIWINFEAGADLREVKTFPGRRRTLPISIWSVPGAVMFSQRVRQVMGSNSLLVAGPRCSVSEAARLMAEAQAGTIVVVENQAVVGIFTERDALFRVLAAGADPQTTHLADVMTADPMTVDPDKSYGHALRLMQAHGFRHMPVVENGRPIGVVCSRNVMDPEMEEFVSEAQRREGFR
jgi:CBS domain-containing protein